MHNHTHTPHTTRHTGLGQVQCTPRTRLHLQTIRTSALASSSTRATAAAASWLGPFTRQRKICPAGSMKAMPPAAASPSSSSSLLPLPLPPCGWLSPASLGCEALKVEGACWLAALRCTICWGACKVEAAGLLRCGKHGKQQQQAATASSNRHNRSEPCAEHCCC